MSIVEGGTVTRTQIEAVLKLSLVDESLQRCNELLGSVNVAVGAI